MLQAQRDGLQQKLLARRRERVELELANEQVARMVKLAVRTQDTMRKLLSRATAAKIDRLSHRVTESFRLSAQARDQLIRLKTRTGISQWNILCRCALCLSLREPTPPSPIDVPADSNVEMTWLVFAGEHHELYMALLKERCLRDGVAASDKELNA